MTDEEIDKMEAGPEMDAMVAEMVMGWERIIVDYEVLADEEDPFRQREQARVAAGELVPYPNGKVLGTPSQVAWRKEIESQDIASVGQYWGDPVTRTIREDEFAPSTSIAAAWEVVERIVKDAGVIVGQNWGMQSGWCHVQRTQGPVDTLHTTSASASTAALAICRAALAWARSKA